MNGWLLGVPNKYVVLGRQQQAGGIKSQRTLWMVNDHWALAPTYLQVSLAPYASPLGLWSIPNLYPRMAGRLPAFLTSGPRALMLPRCIRRPTVIVHWHLGNWKCFSWVWVTPRSEEGPPVSASLSFSLCSRLWHEVCGPMLRVKALISLANVTTLWK